MRREGAQRVLCGGFDVEGARAGAGLRIEQGMTSTPRARNCWTSRRMNVCEIFG